MPYLGLKENIMKNKIIAGNWKMNKTIADTKALIGELIPLVADTNNTVLICVPCHLVQPAYLTTLKNPSIVSPT